MRHLMGEDYDVDYVSKNGCVATVTGRKTGTAGVLELGSYVSDPTWDEGAKVMFDNAYVQIDLPAPLCKVPGKVQVRTKEGITSPLLESNYAMLNQARNFIKMAKGEIEPVTTITEASEDLRIALELVKKRYNL
jgi:hypothetical protein